MSTPGIMIVEDEFAVAADLKSRLEDLGYRVIGHALTGRDAIEQARELQPDLILMDIVLQNGMDGIQAAEEISRILGDIPVVFLTAYSDDDIIARAIAAGSMGLLIKPVQDRDLKAALEMAIHRARMNVRVRETEEKCMILTESVREILILYDAANGRIIHVNKAFEDLYDIPREAVYSNPSIHLERVHPDDRQTVADAFANASKLAGTSSLEYRLYPDGTRWAAARFFPIKDAKGAPSLTAIVAEDITRRRHSEEALRENRELMAMVQGISKFGSWSWVPSTNDVIWSDQVYRIFGVIKDDGCQNLVDIAWEIVHPLDRQMLHRAAVGLLKKRVTTPVEFRLLRFDGEERHARMEAWIIQNEKNDIQKIVGTIQDITAAKRAEEALRTSEEKYRTIVETANEGIWMIDSTETTSFVNRKMADMLGYSPEEMLGRPFYEFVPQPEQASVRAILRQQQAGRKTESDVHLKRRNGGDFWGLASVTPLYTSQNAYQGTLAMVTDISERKKAEEAIRESEARWRHLFKGSPVPAFIWQEKDTDFILLDYNNAAEEITRGRIKDWRGITVSDFFMDSPDVIASFRRCFETRGTIRKQMQRRMITTGDDLEVIATYVYAPPDLVLTHLEDITERKRTEDELRASEERFRTIADYTFDWEFWRGADDQFKWISPSCHRITGYTDTEFYENPNLFFDITHPEDRPVVRAVLEKGARNDKYYHLDFRIIRKDGEVRWISHNVRPVYDRHGVWQGRRASNRDVTGRKEAEEKLLAHQGQLRSLTIELSKAEERERRRIAVGLHDRVGHTLAMCQIRLNQLQMAVGDEKTQQSLEEIVSLVESAISDTRSLTLEISPPSLYELGLEAALDELAQEIEDEHGIRTEVVDDGLPKPLSVDDRVILYRAARECMINVIKHGKSSRMRVSLARFGSRMSVEVADDGVGFDPAELNGNASKKHSYGLFSIRERMSHMGGKFIIQSAPEEGTIATLIVPLEDTPA